MQVDISKLQFLGEGRHRRVYLLPNGRNVLKVPHCPDGEHANWLEYRRFRNRQNWYPLARCRILSNGWLVMQKVDQMPSYEVKPAWSGYVDCRQVGRNAKGDIVAYDYGD